MLAAMVKTGQSQKSISREGICERASYKGGKKWVCKKKAFLFRKLAKHYLCLEGGKKKGIFVNAICFGKIILSLLWKTRKHYEDMGFQQAEGETANSNFSFRKRVFLEGVSETLFTICDPQKLCSLKTLFHSVSAKHGLLQKEKGESSNKTEISQKIVGCVSTCEKVQF